jgi:hypothetical protein
VVEVTDHVQLVGTGASDLFDFLSQCFGISDEDFFSRVMRGHCELSNSDLRVVRGAEVLDGVCGSS